MVAYLLVMAALYRFESRHLSKYKMGDISKRNTL